MKSSLLTLFIVAPLLSGGQNTFPSSGNAGIGVTNPSAGLEINKGSTNNLSLLLNSSGAGWGSGLQLKNTAAAGKSYGIYAGGDGNFHFADVDNAVDRFFISSIGNVGVGTTNPQARLHINPVRPILMTDNGGNGVYGSEIGFNALLNTSVVPNQFKKLGGTSQFGGASMAVDYRGNILFQMFDGNTESEVVTNYSPQIVFLNTGNVGIGTTSPDAKLAVKGTIHSNEVKVDLLGSVAPDYVFEKEYPLTSLTELKSYIDQHKHLPEIPSAKQMEEEGINLKEMNLLLLKKVEELTLYVMEQNKLINAQTERLEKLELSNQKE